MDLSGQMALVTGAGQGIGKACALAMAKAGSDVAVVDINADSVKETAAAITASAGVAWRFVPTLAVLRTSTV